MAPRDQWEPQMRSTHDIHSWADKYMYHQKISPWVCTAYLSSPGWGRALYTGGDVWHGDFIIILITDLGYAGNVRIWLDKEQLSDHVAHRLNARPL